MHNQPRARHTTINGNIHALLHLIFDMNRCFILRARQASISSIGVHRCLAVLRCIACSMLNSFFGLNALIMESHDLTLSLTPRALYRQNLLSVTWAPASRYVVADTGFRKDQFAVVWCAIKGTVRKRTRSFRIIDTSRPQTLLTGGLVLLLLQNKTFDPQISIKMQTQLLIFLLLRGVST